MYGIRRVSGFTLIEIIIVVVVVGILAAIAIPKMLAPNEKIKQSEAKQLLINLLMAQKSYQLENGTYTANLVDLDVTIPSSQYFEVPDVATSNPIASMERTGNLYTMEITDVGVISCTAGTESCPR